MLLQTCSKYVAVFDCHNSSLPHERKGWMASIAQQGDAPRGPACHWLADHQRPFAWLFDALNDGMHVRVPTREAARQLIRRTFGRPGFDLPVITLDDGEKVHQLAATNWVMQNMSAGPEPVRGNQLCEMTWKQPHRYDASPGNAARELRAAGTEQLLSHH